MIEFHYRRDLVFTAPVLFPSERAVARSRDSRPYQLYDLERQCAAWQHGFTDEDKQKSPINSQAVATKRDFYGLTGVRKGRRKNAVTRKIRERSAD